MLVFKGAKGNKGARVKSCKELKVPRVTRVKRSPQGQGVVKNSSQFELDS